MRSTKTSFKGHHPALLLLCGENLFKFFVVALVVLSVNVTKGVHTQITVVSGADKDVHSGMLKLEGGVLTLERLGKEYMPLVVIHSQIVPICSSYRHMSTIRERLQSEVTESTVPLKLVVQLQCVLCMKKDH